MIRNIKCAVQYLFLYSLTVLMLACTSNFSIEGLDLNNPEMPTGPQGGILNSGAEGPEFDVYIGVSENTSTRSYLKRFIFNADTNVVTDSSYFQLSYNSEIRGLGLNVDGNIVATNAYIGNPLEVIDLTDPTAPTLSSTITLDHTLDATKDTVRNHTVCYLPNGNMIVGGYDVSTYVNINEYTSAGVFVRNIHSEPYSSFNISINKCVSRLDTEVHFIVANSSVNGGAKLMRFTRASDSSDWSLADELLDTDFDTAKGSTATAFWSLALDPENEYIYVGRYWSTTSQFSKIIRCPITGFDENNCVGVGDDIPSDTRMKSMVVIPNTGGDLLVFTYLPEKSIYRFKVSDGSWTALFDLTTMDLGSDTYGQSWAKTILK